MEPTTFFVLLALTAAATAWTLFLVWRIRRFLARALRAPGNVTGNDVTEKETMSYGSQHPSETVRYYTPHVSFRLADGSVVEFDSKMTNPGQPLYTPGAAVVVVYHGEDPAGTAEIAGGAVWRFAIFSGLGALVLLLVTVLGKACG